MRVKVLFRSLLDYGATMCKRYRVSVKYTNGPLIGKFVVQIVGVNYENACELYDIWTKRGFDVIVVQMDCKKPDLKKKWFYKPKKKNSVKGEIT